MKNTVGDPVGELPTVFFCSQFFTSDFSTASVGEAGGAAAGYHDEAVAVKQFSHFVNGIFDMTTIVYFPSVIAFFLFLSVQSLEKRRC